jgi:hypothetical protein
MGRPVIGFVFLGPSVRPVARPVVVVRPLSVRPVSSCAVVAIVLLCPFVRPVVRPASVVGVRPSTFVRRTPEKVNRP